MAKKFYAVRVGKTPGIYETWDECKENVHGYPAAEYKSFTTFEEAESFMVNTEYVAKDAVKQMAESPDDNYAFVDGSYNIATKVYGYGGFLVAGSERYELSGCGSDEEMASMRNVAGEILGSRAAIAKALELGLKKVVIYYDYAGIKLWATGEWKRNKKGTIEYYNYVQSVKDKISLEFVKVKGHSGVEGNEEADRIAKKAVGIL